MNVRRGLLMALLCVPLIIALASGFGRDPHAVPSMLVGHPAPPFELPAVDGPQVSLEALRGKPVLINFWATFCYPCQAEHGLLQETAAALEGRAHVVGIIYQDGIEQVRAFLQRSPSVYPHVMDSESRIAMDYGVAGVPESFIVDANGIIVHKQAGVIGEQILAQHLLPLVAPLDGDPSPARAQP